MRLFFRRETQPDWPAWAFLADLLKQGLHGALHYVQSRHFDARQIPGLGPVLAEVEELKRIEPGMIEAVGVVLEDVAIGGHLRAGDRGVQLPVADAQGDLVIAVGPVKLPVKRGLADDRLVFENRDEA